LAPRFELITASDGNSQLVAEGNGRPECFGYIWHPVQLSGGQTYRFRVKFRFAGFEDVNRHLVHGLFAPDSGFNEGIFSYRREGDAVIGERVFSVPQKDMQAELRLYFRFSAAGRVQWEEVLIESADPPPQRLVKVAVSHGYGDMAHWSDWLDAAGKRKVDVALLTEFFNVTKERGGEVPVPQPIDGSAGTLMATKAKQWQMYVSGTFRSEREGIIYNSAPLFDRNGQLVGIYDKNMLFDPELDHGTTPGVGYPVFDADFGKVGIMICYDSWFPEPSRLMAYRGAELILFPSAGYYAELMHARAADNGLVIAASSANCPAGIWDSGGNRVGEDTPEETRYAPTNIVSFERDDEQGLLIATLDLSKTPSPHWWGGPMLSAPASRRVRQTWRIPLEEQIAREARRWYEPAQTAEEPSKVKQVATQ
jgi:predicted amidohydrolase